MNNKYDYEAIMQEHIHKLKKSAGLAGNGSIKYEYILSKDELLDSYLNRLDDLGYPLRVEPKRDRYVMNSAALKKAFEDAATKTIQQLELEIIDFVDKGVMELINIETKNLLSNLTVSNGGIIIPQKTRTQLN